MQFDAYCSQCVLDRQCRIAHELLSPQDAHEHILRCMDIIANAPKGIAAPYLVMKMRQDLAAWGVTEDLYAQEKKDSNDYVLAILPKAEVAIEAADEPLLAAMKYAQVGNFLDFGAMTKDEVNEKITAAVDSAQEWELDEAEFRNFESELKTAKRLLIIGDNAGEIAFDTLLVKQIKKQFPNLSVTYSVRGGNCLNDATREDAAYVGMDKLVPVIDNGSAISGTEFGFLGQEMADAIENADVILAKGQANFETMVDCGYNVYYNFLCKCERLCKILQKERFTGMFLAEKRIGKPDPFPA